MRLDYEEREGERGGVGWGGVEAGTNLRFRVSLHGHQYTAHPTATITPIHPYMKRAYDVRTILEYKMFVLYGLDGIRK
jgi:hypothetical protein